MSVVQGSGRPTLAAVAREAGVSSPTVSKVINGREDVAAYLPKETVTDGFLLLYPHVHRTDGAFGARLRRLG